MAVKQAWLQFMYAHSSLQLDTLKGVLYLLCCILLLYLYIILFHHFVMQLGCLADTVFQYTNLLCMCMCTCAYGCVIRKFGEG